ncbi:MAG TPA: hypothetical protein VKA89_05195 [Solirubrobacterales bacterium]|nr:hypothetical protein [Solirubrobacterales bacterium]
MGDEEREERMPEVEDAEEPAGDPDADEVPVEKLEEDPAYDPSGPERDYKGG